MPTKREGVKRMVVGALLFFLLAPAIFVGALWFGISRTVDTIDDAQRLKPGESVQLDAGEQVKLFIFDGITTGGDGATAGSDQTPSPVQCTATGPDGQPVDLRTSSGKSVSNDGQRWQESYELTAGPAGAYRVTCGTSEVLVLDSDFVKNLATKVGGTLLLAIVLPFLVGMTGLGLFIWGIVKYTSNKPPPVQPGYATGGYPPPSGYYPPQQPTQPPIEHREGPHDD
ncbi:hypothetical protein [Luteipulveratus mongoliensis]|uniref:Uncharacterized protein n=1 Tax=Luteipulveratus mongoliensis TaxID=571913 RepID=A0A0K1JN09_9MICO|nr:hypothetical protein [Luteipulveratus mongoliensis]AKU17965.1 hypothetical protein VV02_22365 [Luteipulveratus mongoliensis]